MPENVFLANSLNFSLQHSCSDRGHSQPGDLGFSSAFQTPFDKNKQHAPVGWEICPRPSSCLCYRGIHRWSSE